MSDHSIADKQAKHTEKLAAIREFPLLAKVSAELLPEIEPHIELVRYRPGVNVLIQGDKTGSLLMIVSGQVRIEITKEAIDGAVTTVPIAHRGPGDYLGELSLIDGEPHMADAMTIEACTILRMSRTGFNLCWTKAPGFSLTICRELVRRLRQARREYVWHQSGGALRRLATRLLEEVELHSTSLPDGGIRIEARLKHEKLAEAIGVTRETITRTITMLQGMNILRVEGRTLVVIDLAKLKECARRARNEKTNLETFKADLSSR